MEPDIERTAMEHLSVEQREAMITSIKLACDYLCDYSTDAGLFALQALVAQHAAQIASRLAYAGDYPGDPPQSIGAGMSENLAPRLGAMQGLGT